MCVVGILNYADYIIIVVRDHMKKLIELAIFAFLIVGSNGCICSIVLEKKIQDFDHNSNEIIKKKNYKGSYEGDTIIDNDKYYLISINNALKVPKGNVIKLFIPAIEDSIDLSKFSKKDECIKKMFDLNQSSENKPIEVNVLKPNKNNRVHDIDIFRTVFHDKNKVFDKIINDSINSPKKIGISILSSDTTRVDVVYGLRNKSNIEYVYYHSKALYLKRNWRTENRLLMYKSMKPVTRLIDLILFPVYLIGLPIIIVLVF
jgi:hypothetical protein